MNINPLNGNESIYSSHFDFNKDRWCVSDRNLGRVAQMNEIYWILPSVELRQEYNGYIAEQE